MYSEKQRVFFLLQTFRIGMAHQLTGAQYQIALKETHAWLAQQKEADPDGGVISALVEALKLPPEHPVAAMAEELVGYLLRNTGSRSGGLKNLEALLKAIDQVDPDILAKPVRAAAVAIMEQAVAKKKAPPASPANSYDDDVEDDDEEEVA
jgi:hypothetical protein